ncbi:hypothetical protein [Caldibacillus thermoamylovorans]|uniref:hypothetical protein n=1 Tax=Caldibacillus thermoamylovorans TaxID=35841 RepID=UPI0012601BED|nr:hypothetical protein [Caldibacillus thermoamylovorans]
MRKSCFWRRNLISSLFLCEKVVFFATRSFLVVILSRETPFFGDETLSRRHFEVKTAQFWRRDLISSVKSNILCKIEMTMFSLILGKD